MAPSLKLVSPTNNSAPYEDSKLEKKYLVAKTTNVHVFSISSNKKMEKKSFANVSVET